ncbi:MAG: SCO family protein [Parvularculales bacterium]
MKKLRLVLWATVVVALAAFIIFNVRDHNDPDRTDGPQGTSAADFFPSFSLTDHLGKPVTGQTYRGKWLLVFFGFTHCPDICPTTLAELARVMDLLGSKAEAVKPLFISIDPERDRVKPLGEYVSAFHPAITGLTGTGKQVAGAAQAFRVYFEKQEQDTAPDGYTMGHTSSVYLISPDGAFVRTYDYGTPPELIAGDLKEKL